MVLDHKTNSTANARLLFVHLQKSLLFYKDTSNSSQEIRTACTKNYPYSIQKPHSRQVLTDLLLRALQEMQHNSNITTVVHTATTQNVQSLAESKFTRQNLKKKKNTLFHTEFQLYIPANFSPFADI